MMNFVFVGDEFDISVGDIVGTLDESSTLVVDSVGQLKMKMVCQLVILLVLPLKRDWYFS